MLIHSFDAFSVDVIYNFHSHENKENSLNEKCGPNFWSVLYIYFFYFVQSVLFTNINVVHTLNIR